MQKTAGYISLQNQKKKNTFHKEIKYFFKEHIYFFNPKKVFFFPKESHFSRNNDRFFTIMFLYTYSTTNTVMLYISSYILQMQNVLMVQN